VESGSPILPEHVDVVHFVNADLIASGLSPLKPELAAIAAARLVLREIDRLAAERMDCAFETTCSGVTYVRLLETWKQAGYRIEIVYLRLRSAELALRRIAARVRQGGHNVPRADVLRRFARGWENLQSVYRPLADSSKGRPEDRAHVRHASIRVGQRQGRSEETISCRAGVLCQECDELRLGVPGMCHGGLGERAGKRCK
jgi:predicted ABC-type ATPase